MQAVNRNAQTQVPVGRFAPSPSGPLHFGSLVSALASYLDIRSRQGRWLLRIDDLDAPRNVEGSEQAILDCLRAHALLWDGRISRQSDHSAHYIKALFTLAERKLLFFCNCSRQSLRDLPRYPGTCRHNLVNAESLENYLAQNYLAQKGERSHAIRLKAANDSESVTDELQTAADRTSSTNSEAGDYVVFRRDGLVSYQLAVVVDDMLTGVNRVVRGADLLPTTARQQALHRLLNSEPPDWLHLPVLLNQRLTKLSKQAKAQAVDSAAASANLDMALQLLGQVPPAGAHRMPATELVDWASHHWQPARLPAEQTLSTFIGW